jgi:hypothetical protein
MRTRTTLLPWLLAAAAALAGCAAAPAPDTGPQGPALDFTPVAGKARLYVCREKAAYQSGAIESIVTVDGKPVGNIRASTVVHTLVEPGRHEILLRNVEATSNIRPPRTTINASAGELVFLWVGVTGRGWGLYSIDGFRDTASAQACVRDAQVRVSAP